MIRAAIVGIGRWGRTLVNSVQGKSTAFHFTAGEVLHGVAVFAAIVRSAATRQPVKVARR